MKNYYLKEYEYFDDDYYIIFTILGLNFDNKTIEIAISNRGKLSVKEYDLFQDCNGDFYFEYGVMLDKIYIKEFKKFEI